MQKVWFLAARRVPVSAGTAYGPISFSGARPLEREISVDRVSYKDAGTKQTKDCCDRFNHFDAPILRYWERLIARACFKIVSSTRHNGFVPTGRDPPRGGWISRGCHPC